MLLLLGVFRGYGLAVRGRIIAIRDDATGVRIWRSLPSLKEVELYSGSCHE
jgi:hypothetical protein